MTRCLTNRLGRVMVGLLVGGLLAPLSAAEASGSDVHRSVGADARKGSEVAELVRVTNGIAVIQFEGNYHRSLSDGTFNEAPRQAVARAALEAFGDDVDFLLVLSSFDFDMGDARGFAVGIANEVSGIGDEIYDYSEHWGSNGRLQLYADLGPIESWELDPVRPAFEDTLTVALHELFHRWLFRPQIAHPTLPVDALVGHQGAHWSYLADSDASLLYGADWRDNGDGTHTAVQILRRLSPLDLYLAGFYAADEVPPIRVIVDPAGAAGLFPRVGATATGGVVEVAIEDVLAALGPRVPAAEGAPKRFRVGVVALVRDPSDPIPIESIERLGREVATRFSILTAGRGSLSFGGAVGEGTPGSADPVGGGGPTRPTADLSAAATWLRAQQAADGSWADRPATAVRDTALAAWALVATDGTFVGAPRESTRDWLRAVASTTVDDLAHAALGAAVVDYSGPVCARMDELVAAAGAAAGAISTWGPSQGYGASSLDTALALRAAKAVADRVGTCTSATAGLSGITTWLLAAQNPDGGWGTTAEGSSRLLPTAWALEVLGGASHAEARAAGQAWLLDHQNADGGFGDDGSTAWLTATAIETLLQQGLAGSPSALAAEAYLEGSQLADGSWEGSVAATAAVVSLLPRLTAPNLHFVTLPQAVPEAVSPGEPVELRVEVGNSGGSLAAPTTLRWLVDGPEGTALADTPIPALLPQQRLVVSTTWDTAAVAPGEHQVIVRLDPDNLVQEATELDNEATVVVLLEDAPAGPELAVSVQEVALVPRHPTRLPSDVELTAVVRNLGLTPVVGARVVVATVEGATHADVLVDIGPRSTALINATIPVLAAAPFAVAVLADPDDDVDEANEDNNLAVVEVEPAPTFDAEVTAQDVVLSPGNPVVGESFQIAVAAHNRGTLDIPALTVRVDIRVDGVVVHTENWTDPVSTLSATSRSIPWVIPTPGSVSVEVTADPANQLAEFAEENNATSVTVEVGNPGLANLVVDSLQLAPDPPAVGLPLQAVATVRNLGGVLATAVDVALFDGDPAHGGVEVARTTVAELAVGAAPVVALEWPQVPDVTPRLLFVVVDPDGVIVETRETDNTVWLQVHPANLADLAVAPAGIDFDPPFPVGGENVAVHVEVGNLGGQGVADVVVRLSADGVAVAEVVLAWIGAASTAVAEISWPTPEHQPTAELFVEVDPADLVPELDEGNNSAAVSVVLQDGAASVDQRYFSPNGDGVRDTTLLTFRLEAAAEVRVEVRDRWGRVAREEPLGNQATGSWRWDGKDTLGRLVADGDWTLAVVDDQGDRAAATVTLDTNRAPLGVAVGAGLVRERNLTCGLPDSSLIHLARDDREAFFDIRDANPQLPRGLYRMSLGPGARPAVIVDAAWFADRGLRLGGWVVEPEFGSVAFAAQTLGFLVPRTWWATPGGSLVDTGVTGNPIGFLGESRDLMIGTSAGSRRYRAGVGVVGPILPPPVDVSTYSGIPSSFAPHSDHYVGVVGDALVLVEASSGLSQPLNGAPTTESYPGVVWRGIDNELLVIDHEGARLHFFDGSNSSGVVDLPLLPAEAFGGPVGTFLPGVVSSASWSTASHEVAVGGGYSDGNLFVAASWVYDRVTEEWALIGVTEPVDTGHSFVVSREARELGTLRYGPRSGLQRLDVGAVGGSLELIVRHHGSTEGLIDAAVLRVGGWRTTPAVVEQLEPSALTGIDGTELDITGEAITLRWDDVPAGRGWLELIAREPRSGFRAGDQSVGVASQPQPSRGTDAKLLVSQPLSSGHAEFLPWSRTLLFLDSGGFASKIHLLDLDDPTRTLLEVLSDHSSFYAPRLSPTGKSLQFGSARDGDDPASECFDAEFGFVDEFLFQSLANLENDLVVSPLPSGAPGFALVGTATDLAFSRRRLESAPFASPNATAPIGVPSSTMVVDEQLGVWAPPASGSWLVRQLVEDRAGNARISERRVEVASVSSITDLVVEPELFSPLAGPVTISYRLIRPFQSDIQIIDAAGSVVRTIAVSHPCCVGETVSVPWNGRNHQGVVVPDGRYTVELLGFEIDIEVDGTPPLIDGLSVAGPRGSVAGTMSVSTTVHERHLADVVLESGVGSTPLVWEPLRSWSVGNPATEDPWSFEVQLTALAATGRSFRATARDRFGNLAQRVSGVVAQRVESTGVGAVAVLPDGRRKALSEIAATAVVELETGPQALRIAETVVAPIVLVELQRRLADGPQDSPWVSIPNLGFLDPNGVSVSTSPADGVFDVAFDALDLPSGEIHELRALATDTGGSTRETFPVRVRHWSVAFRGLAWQLPDQPEPPGWGQLRLLLQSLAHSGRGLAWARYEPADLPIANATLMLSSRDDPRFVVPVSIPHLASGNGIVLFELPEALESEVEYQGVVQLASVPLAPSGGGPPRPLTVQSPPGYFDLPPLSIVTSVEPVTRGEGCGRRFDDRVLLGIEPISASGDPLVLLTVERLFADGSTQLVGSFPVPVSGARYEIEVATDSWAEGPHPEAFRATLIDATEARAEEEMDLVVDRSVPVVRLLAPSPGASSCGRFQLAAESVDTGTGATTRLMPVDPLREFEPGCPACLPQFGAVAGPFGPTRSVEAGPFLRAWRNQTTIASVDGAGNVGCLDVAFDIDLAAQVSDLLLPQESSFSPDDDGLFETLAFSTTVGEPYRLGLELRPSASHTAAGCATTEPVAAEIDLGQLAPGPVDFSWDGLGPSGVVPDGLYEAKLVGEDACGYEPGFSTAALIFLVDTDQCVWVDTVAPVVAIESPIPGAQLPVVTEVWGSIFDATSGIRSWYLEAGQGVDPVNWLPIASGTLKSSSVLLGTWNTFGLYGPYVLRLIAEDKVGHLTEARVPVELGAPNVAISDLAAAPSPFSPNGDGRREVATVRFVVELAGRVRLAIEGPDELTVQVLSDSMRSPGVHTVGWDGRGSAGAVLPDGPYRVVADAFATGDPAPRQTEVVTLALDATSPAIEFTDLAAGGFVDVPLVVVGSVADPLLAGWASAIAPGDLDEWTLLAESTTSVADGSLADLEELSEGEWRLRIEADDLAENRASLVLPFTVDRTPPEVAIEAPPDGALFGSSSPAIPILGRASDDHLASWTVVAFPAGSSDPSERLPVAGGEEPIEGELAQLPALGFPDGAWTVELACEDLAGHRTVAAVTIVLDRTPPAVAIAAPAAGAWIRGPAPVLGLVADPHLVDWRLAVAAGSSPNPSGFATIVSGHESVDGQLGTWILLPPDGPATLALSGRDAVGNEATATVVLQVDTSVPPRPLALTATKIAPRDVRLEWAPVADPNLAGYLLDRGGVALDSTPVAGPSFDDLGVPDGVHEYRVRAIDLAGNVSDPSPPAVVAIDTTPPIVAISAPADGGWVRGATDIMGSATSDQPDFVEYWVEIGSPLGGSTEIRRSPAPVVSGLLASWTPDLALDGETVTIRVSAEDLAGNVASISIAVAVDLGAPPAPLQLVAVPAPANPSEDVELTWTAVVVPDLLGYVVFRDGAALTSVQSPITTTTWVDPLVPDGTFTWTVVAVDRALNESAHSNPATLDLDRHAPSARIVRPLEGHRFDGLLPVLATSVDRDVAAVTLEWRTPVGVWVGLGPALIAEPWTSTLDPLTLGLERGLVELRAVATDHSGHTDPAPAVVAVEYADLTAPPAPIDLAAAVDGDTVTLAWSAVDLDAVSWRIEEYFAEVQEDGQVAEWVEWVAEVAELRAVVSAVALGSHRWQVVAIDAAGNESAPSALAAGLIHRPRLVRVLTPRLETSAAIRGSSDVPLSIAEVEITPAMGLSSSFESGIGADGLIALGDLALEPGDQSIVVRVRDAAGNRSLPDTLWVWRDALPADPTGLGVTVEELEATLSWDASFDADHLGWRIIRGEATFPTGGPVPIVSVSAPQSAWPGTPEGAIDSDPTTWWSPIDPQMDTLEAELSGLEIVHRVALTWDSDAEGVLYAPLAVELEAWDGRDWIPVGGTTASAASTWQVELVRPYRAALLRLLPRGSLVGEVWGSVRLVEFAVHARPALALATPAPTFVDLPGDGHWTWSVEQVDTFGFASGQALVTADVGDVLAPAPVVLSGSAVGADVQLSWTASGSPDVVSYDLRRDGVLFERVIGLSTEDVGRPNGTWTYEVRAVDAAGNESLPSNLVPVLVFVEVPVAPIELDVAVDPAGRALDLVWVWPGAEPPVGGYRVRRGLVAGGPWQPVGTSATTTWRDEGVETGTTYYYVIEALDELGNASLASNEASGTPVDRVPPSVPRPIFPAIGGQSLSSYRSSIPFAGFADPGSDVVLLRGAGEAGTATARTNAAQTTLASDVLWFDPAPDGSWCLVTSLVEDCGGSQCTTSEMARLVDPAGQTVPLPLVGTSWAWLPDGAGLVSTESAGLWRVDLSGIAERLWVADAFVMGVAARNVESAVVLAEHQGIFGVWLVELASGEADFLVELDPDQFFNLDGRTLAVSPGGRWLVYPAYFGLMVIDLENGTAHQSGAAAETLRPSWSPSGSHVAWSAPTDGGVWVLDTSSMVVSEFGEAGDRAPVWSPDGAAIAVLDSEGELQLRGWPGSGLQEFDAPVSFAPVRWAASGNLFGLDAFGGVWRLEPAGLARFPSVPLLPGLEVFRMASIDETGNRSASSSPFSVERLAPTVDLVVPEFGVGVVPADPDVGEVVRVTAAVHNAGALPAGASRLVATWAGADGVNRPVLDVVIGPLEPGETAVRDVSLVVPGPVGLAALVVEADRDNQVPERDETNNRGSRLVPVGLAGAATLDVSTDQPSYGASIPVVVTAQVVGGGGGPVRLAWSIVDSAGFEVVTLAPVELGSLAAGELREFVAAWHHTGVFAGSYRVTARLLPAVGASAAVAEDTAAFVVLPWHDLAAAVVPRPVVSERGGEVDLDGRLEYPAGNMVLEGLIAYLEVLDGGGVVEHRSENSLGALLPGAVVSLTSRWDTGEAPAGARSVRLRIVRGGSEIASASALLELLPRPADLRGYIAPTDPEAVLGTPIGWHATVRNLGDVPVADLPVRVRLLDGATLAERGVDSTIRAVGAHQSVALDGSFSTAELSPGVLLLVLEVERDGAWGLLAQTSLIAVDRTPPVVTVLEPQPGALLGRQPALLLRATDLHGEPLSVTYAVDGGVDQVGLPIEPAEATWGGALPEVEGFHSVVVTASDRWGNRTEVAPVPYEVDLTPPTITVLGVFDGEVRQAPITPTIVVEDLHLGHWSATLDGTSFDSGTTLEGAGIYELLVVATDLVGNRAEAQLNFTISTATVVVATLVDTLADDVVADGVPSAGDLLGYRAEVRIEGAGAAAVELVVPIPTGLIYEPGSVSTDRGVVTSESPPTVHFGAMASGELATVEFTARVVAVPPEVIWAQGFVNATGVPAVATDDPDLPGAADPTLTVIDQRAFLVASKVGSVASGLDSALPGDRLVYQLVVTNRGSASASGVLVRDVLPAGTELLPNTILLATGVVASLSPLHVDFGELAAGASTALEFEALVTGPFAPTAETVDNQAWVEATGLEPRLSDDPRLPGLTDPTRIPLSAAARPAVSLTVDMLLDVDSDGALGLGDRALYRLEVRPRVLDLSGLAITIPFPAWAELQLDSVVTSQGTVSGTVPLTLTAAALPRGTVWSGSFEVELGVGAPEGASMLALQALVVDSGGSTLSDDPRTPVALDETVVPTFAPPVLSAVASQVVEGDTGATTIIEITLNQVASPHEGRVGWATRDATGIAGVDYTASSGIVTIPVGATSASLTLAILGDDLEEGDETFFVDLLDPFDVVLAVPSVAVTILDDDQPAIPAVANIADAGILEGGNLTFTISRDQTSTTSRLLARTLTTGTATPDSDFTPVTDLLVELGPGVSSREFVVATLVDGLAEFDETVLVEVVPVSGVTVVDGLAVGSIADSDGPVQLVVSGQTVAEGEPVTFTVVSSPPAAYPFSVVAATRDVAATAGADYIALGPELVTFVVGATTAEVVVSTLEDGLVESAESFELLLSDPVDAEIEIPVATATIVDTTALPVLSVVDVEVGEASGQVTVEVLLDRPASAPVLVNITTVPGTALDGEDFIGAAAGIQLAVGVDRASFVVTILDDLVHEPTEQFSVEVTSLTGATIGSGTAAVTILDDDPAVLAASFTLAASVDGVVGGVAGPGSLVDWTLELTLVGAGQLADVALVDELPIGLELVPGSVLASHGVVASFEPLRVEVAAVPVGEVLRVAFVTRVVGEALAPDTVWLSNQASVGAVGLVEIASDDPSTPEPGDPTLVLVDLGQPSVLEIPALAPTGTMLLVVLLAGFGVTLVRSRRRVPASRRRTVGNNSAEDGRS